MGERGERGRGREERETRRRADANSFHSFLIARNLISHILSGISITLREIASTMKYVS